MKKPEPQDFGITPWQHALYDERTEEQWVETITVLFACIAAILIPLGIALAVGRITGNSQFAIAAGFLSLWPGLLLIGPATGSVIRPIIRFHRTRARSRLLKSEVGTRIISYEEAKLTFQAIQAEAEKAQWRAEQERQKAEQQWRLRRRQLHDHWMSLSGREFEWELATLYRYLGYDVEATPITGDQGIDLVLRKDGKTTIVQCKSHKSPVGPAVARELLGSMVAIGADDAILACTGGFTRGVKEFAVGKPIDPYLSERASQLGKRCRE